MHILDGILLVVLLFGVCRGWFLGFIKQILSIGGLVIGFMVAKCNYKTLGLFLMPYMNVKETLACMIAFALIWIVIPLVLGLLAEILHAILDKICMLGFLNRTLGALLGLITYLFIGGLLVWVCDMVGIIGHSTMQETKLCCVLSEIPQTLYLMVTNNGK